MSNEMILVLDFGGQYNQLIARRVRECNVYCEVHPYTLSLEKIKEILESDLSSPDEILYLMLSFRFIDLENEEENRSGSSQPEKHR